MVYSDTKVALGSNCVITVSTIETDVKFINKLFQQLWLKIFQFEQNFSRFLPDSQLTKFNAMAGIKQPISPEFRELLLACRKYAVMTRGIFNPFILPVLENVGYDHSFLPGFEKDRYEKHSRAQLIDLKSLEIFDHEAFIPKNSAIDLGGLGKGFLADKLANFLLGYKDKIMGFWISLGGDIHTYGLEESYKPWKIYIEKDLNDNLAYIESIKDQSLSIATSGVNYRRGIKENKNWHHIIDPRTGLSAKTDLLSATVVGHSTIYCDVLASCLIIEVNKKNFKRKCQEYKITDALIQGHFNNTIQEEYYFKTIGRRIKINKND